MFKKNLICNTQISLKKDLNATHLDGHGFAYGLHLNVFVLTHNAKCQMPNALSIAINSHFLYRYLYARLFTHLHSIKYHSTSVADKMRYARCSEHGVCVDYGKAKKSDLDSVASM